MNRETKTGNRLRSLASASLRTAEFTTVFFIFKLFAAENKCQPSQNQDEADCLNYVHKIIASHRIPAQTVTMMPTKAVSSLVTGF